MKIPRPYQLEAIEHMKEHNTYLCDSCGLGKTLVGIESVRGLKKNLVICRKSAKAQWKEAILEQLPDAEVIITNHYPFKFNEINAWFIAAPEELTPRSLLYPIARVVWNSIILDEAHMIKNYHTARSKNITKLAGARKIALSATPIEKHGGELWPVLKWLAPEKFPAYWKWVESMFEVSPGFYGGFDIGDPIDLVDYQAEVMPYIIRRTKGMVAPQLPPRIDIEVPIQMTDEQYAAYTEMAHAKDALVLIQDIELLITNALTLFTRLHQLSSLPSMLGLDITSAKMVWLKEFVEDHQDMRLLVFSRYREVVEYVRREFDAWGVFTVMGGINESERFKNGEGKILAGTLDAMSESLSLGMADAAIFIDQHWSSRVMAQAVDRIHRMDITDKKLVYYLRASKVDQKVMNVVQGKYDDQEMLLDFVRD